MASFTVDQILKYTKKWLFTGELNVEMLADKFHFISPFWESNDKQAFLDKFLDPSEYKEKSLSNYSGL